MTKEEVEKLVLACAKEDIFIPPYYHGKDLSYIDDIDSNFEADWGADSLEITELLYDLEEKLGIELHGFRGYKTPADVAEQVYEEVNKKNEQKQV